MYLQLVSYLQQKISTSHKTVHLIFLLKNNTKLFFDEIRKFVSPTTCGLFTYSNLTELNQELPWTETQVIT